MDYCIVIHQFINLSIFLLQLHVYKREKIKPFKIFYCHPQNADKTIPICDTIPLNSTLDNGEGKNDKEQERTHVLNDRDLHCLQIEFLCRFLTR